MAAFSTTRTVLVVFMAGVIATLVAGCAMSAPPTPAKSSARPSQASAPTPSVTVVVESPPERVAPTCENIMSADFSTDWAPQQVEWPDEPVFADGITCRWQADPAVGTDNVLMFAWAPADSDDWSALVRRMHASSSDWFVLQGERGEYLTSESEHWVHDDERYGAAYLFTGDAVIWAMTKAETDVVVGPPLAN